jgi:hypothetical protein
MQFASALDCQGRYPEFGSPGVSIPPDTGWGDVAGGRSLFPAARAVRDS